MSLDHENYLNIVVVDKAPSLHLFAPYNASPPEPEIHSWPRRAKLAELNTCLMKYGGDTVMQSSPSWADSLDISNKHYSLVYEREDMSDYWKLMSASDGVPHAPAPQPVSLGVHKVFQEESHAPLARNLRRVIPGLDHVVEWPCDHKQAGILWGAIQHLNDAHHPESGSPDVWTRERIADWTEALPFDLTIDPEAAEQLKARQEYDETHQAQYQEAVKKLMENMIVSQETFMKSMSLSFEKVKKACEGLQKDLAKVEFTADTSQMQETLHVEWEKMNPKEDT